jgi:hypothetical protein
MALLRAVMKDQNGSKFIQRIGTSAPIQISLAFDFHCQSHQASGQRAGFLGVE